MKGKRPDFGENEGINWDGTEWDGTDPYMGLSEDLLSKFADSFLDFLSGIGKVKVGKVMHMDYTYEIDYWGSVYEVTSDTICIEKVLAERSNPSSAYYLVVFGDLSVRKLKNNRTVLYVPNVSAYAPEVKFTISCYMTGKFEDYGIELID